MLKRILVVVFLLSFSVTASGCALLAAFGIGAAAGAAVDDDED
jgi:hypothetical protein